MHGGTAPQVKAKADRDAADADAAAAVRRILDDPDAAPVTDPIDRLARLAGRIEHAADAIGERVSALTAVGIVTAAGGEQLRAEVVLWEKLLGHLHGALNSLIRAGYMERQQAAAEQQAHLLGQIVAAALDAAGVAGPAREVGMATARDRLIRLVS